MKHRFFTFYSLTIVLALLLAACGAPPSTGWPGLATNGDVVFVAFNQQVHAVNIADGRQLWAFPSAPDNNSGLYFADPGYSTEMLLVGSDGPNNSYSGVLFGLDPANGSQKWCLAMDTKAAQRHQNRCPLAPGAGRTGLFGIAPPADNRIVGGITVAGGMAYFGLANAYVYAVEVATGNVQWTFKAENAVWAAPQADEDTVYVVSLDHFVYALRRADGSVKWTRELGSAIAGTPALLDGMLYVGTFGNKLHAIDARTGDVAWSKDANNWVWGGPVAREDTVFYADLAGTIFAVDARTGAQRWAEKPGGALRDAPALNADTLYIGDRDGRFFALDIATGAVKWTQDVKGELLANPLVVQDLVIIAPFNGDNLLEAYTTAGAMKWVFAPSK